VERKINADSCNDSWEKLNYMNQEVGKVLGEKEVLTKRKSYLEKTLRRERPGRKSSRNSNREDDNHKNSNNKDPSHDIDHYVEQIIEQNEQLKKEKKQLKKDNKELNKKSQYLEKRIRNQRKSHKSSKNSNNYDIDKATIIELVKECTKVKKINTKP
jgi:hypothetical protein